jgi:hypothetical protein
MDVPDVERAAMAPAQVMDYWAWLAVGIFEREARLRGPKSPPPTHPYHRELRMELENLGELREQLERALPKGKPSRGYEEVFESLRLGMPGVTVVRFSAELRAYRDRTAKYDSEDPERYIVGLACTRFHEALRLGEAEMDALAKSCGVEALPPSSGAPELKLTFSIWSTKPAGSKEPK